MNNYQEQLEALLEEFIELIDDDPVRENCVVETVDGGIVEVGDQLTSLVHAAQDLLYHGDIEDDGD